MPTLGQPIKIQVTSGRYSAAFVTKVVDGDEINLVALTDAVQPWPSNETPNGLVAAYFNSVDKGSGVGQWQELDLPESITDAITASVAAAIAGLAEASYVDAGDATTASDAAAALAAAVAALEAEIAGLPAPDLSGRLAVPSTAGSAVSLAFGATQQNTSGRPVLVTMCGSWTAGITGTGSVEIRCDSGSTPTTVKATLPVGLSLGLLSLSTVMPWSVTFLVPDQHYYKAIASTGSTGTFATASVNEAVL